MSTVGLYFVNNLKKGKLYENEKEKIIDCCSCFDYRCAGVFVGAGGKNLAS